MPSPDCNPCSAPDEPPKMPPGFTLTVDRKGPQRLPGPRAFANYV
jgi:hypothetical protein